MKRMAMSFIPSGINRIFVSLHRHVRNGFGVPGYRECLGETPALYQITRSQNARRVTSVSLIHPDTAAVNWSRCYTSVLRVEHPV